MHASSSNHQDALRTIYLSLVLATLTGMIMAVVSYTFQPSEKKQACCFSFRLVAVNSHQLFKISDFTGTYDAEHADTRNILSGPYRTILHIALCDVRISVLLGRQNRSLLSIPQLCIRAIIILTLTLTLYCCRIQVRPTDATPYHSQASSSIYNNQEK